MTLASEVGALVVGGGIAGMQSALDLADPRLSVALVDGKPALAAR
jgi:heterodisulfide reductase subunit A-like polyferredoxin